MPKTPKCLTNMLFFYFFLNVTSKTYCAAVARLLDKTGLVNIHFKNQHLVKPKQTDTPVRVHAGKIL